MKCECLRRAHLTASECPSFVERLTVGRAELSNNEPVTAAASANGLAIPSESSSLFMALGYVCICVWCVSSLKHRFGGNILRFLFLSVKDISMLFYSLSFSVFPSSTILRRRTPPPMYETTSHCVLSSE